MRRHGSLWVPESVEQQLQRGLCSVVADGDVLTRDSTLPGASGSLAGETKFGWKPAGAGGGQKALEKRVADLCNQESTATNQAGGNNVGWKFIPRTSGMACYGVRFYWKPGATNRTVRARLLDVQSATVLASDTVNILANASGIYQVTWADVTMVAGKPHFVDAWETDNVQLTYCTIPAHGLDIRYGYWGPFIESASFWFGAGLGGGAETEVSLGNPQVMYPVEPLVRDLSGIIP